MSAALVLAFALSGALGAEPEPAFCETPADCAGGATCVAGRCRSGRERTAVERLHTVAVPEPLALGGTSWLPGEAVKLGRALAGDLAWTGFYDVVLEHALPAAWRTEGVSPSEMRRTAWQVAGAYRVLKATLSPARDPGSYRLRIRAVEVESFRVVDLPEGNVVVPAGGTRRAAARYVNALVAHDTGMPGIAGTRLLASVQVKPGIKEIGVMDADGGAFQLLTSNGSLNLGPTWGPGGRVGYMSYARGNADWLVDGVPLSTRPGLNAAGDWSPDGKLLALSLAEGENSDIVLLYAKSGEEHSRLTDHPGVDTSPAWHPDGRRIAFVSDRTGSPQVFVARIDGIEFTKVSQGAYVTSPEWSPDGGTLLYALRTGGDSFAILSHDLASGAVTRLTTSGASAESPVFSPDGRYIAYVQREGGGDPSLWIMNADGSNPRPVPRPPGRPAYPMFAPAWGP